MVAVFSALGGQIYTLSAIFIFLYHGTNYYKLIKHIVLHVVIGKASLYPSEYDLKRDFCK